MLRAAANEFSFTDYEPVRLAGQGHRQSSILADMIYKVR